MATYRFAWIVARSDPGYITQWENGVPITVLAEDVWIEIEEG